MPEQRGTMTHHGNVSRINNALVEEVSTNNGRTGHLIVSYAVRGRNQITVIETLRLIVNWNTAVRNQFGLPFCFCNITPGMWVDVEFSSAMTRSIPPQAVAFRIVVRQIPPSTRPPAGVTRIDRIINVDSRNNFIMAGNPLNMNQQIRFIVSEDTVILNRNGRQISLRDLRPGQTIEVTHSNAMTASIPPQTTAFRIRVL